MKSIQVRLTELEKKIDQLVLGKRHKIYIRQEDGTLKFHNSFPDDVDRIIILEGMGYIPPVNFY